MRTGFAILCSTVLVAAGAPAFCAAITLDATSRTLEIRGSAAGDYFGRPVACTDLDGDGRGDLAVCADRSTFNPGQRPTVFVFRGGAQYYSAGMIDLALATADAVILGDTGSDNLASALTTGDINGDGRQDLILADSTIAAGGRAGAGAVYVIFGSAGFFSKGTYDLAAGDWSMKLLGSAAGDDTGGSLLFGGATCAGLATGDITNDGIADLAIGAHLANANSKSDAGKVMVVRGRTSYAPGTVLDLATQADSVILGSDDLGELGTAIAIGDINADNVADLVLGNEYGSISVFSSHGKIFAFWGGASFPASVNLATQSPNLLVRGKSAGDQLGTAVAMSDINDDGRPDLVATASGWDHATSSSLDEGAVYAFFGRASWPSVIDLASASADVFVEGLDNSNNIGGELVAGDFNGDGTGDFLFGTRDGERLGFSSEGRLFGVFGRAGIPAAFSVQAEDFDLVVNGATDYLQLGDTLGSGDIDGDGATEMFAAAPFVDSSTGRLYVFDLNPVPTAARDWQLLE